MFLPETGSWICKRCKHEFGTDLKFPKKLSPDGSPSNGDSERFKFYIAGVLSFMDVGKGCSKEFLEEAVKSQGFNSETHGVQSVAFLVCSFKETIEDMIMVNRLMDE